MAADAPEFRIPCDYVIVAIGQAIEAKPFEAVGGGFAHVLRPDFFAPVQGREGFGGLEHDDVGAVPVHPGGDGLFHHRAHAGLVSPHARQQAAGRHDAFSQKPVLFPPVFAKFRRIALKIHAAGHDRHALFRFGHAAHFHAKAETVQQLRPQFAFFRVHGAHQGKTRRMRPGKAFALHGIDAHGRGVQQDVHQMVVQQIHLVHIENAPVGGGQQAVLETAAAVGQGRFHIQ